MQAKTLCSICFEKECGTVLSAHWKTGVIQPFTVATCDDEACKKEYDKAMTEADFKEPCYEEA